MWGQVPVGKRRAKKVNVSERSLGGLLFDKLKQNLKYIKNILKVLKITFRDATDLYGFINYNPTITLKVPNKYPKKNE